MLTITPAAEKKVASILKDEGVSAFRIAVVGGGCSGFQYAFTLDYPNSAEATDPDDLIVEFNGGKIIIDPMSLQYLNEAIIDYQSDLMGSKFVINNPNVKAACGCGSSFTVD